jgi:hypothetical protein
MTRKRRKTSLVILAVFSLFLMSWGYNGHQRINHHASLSFTPEMQQFLAWTTTLAEHASDADDRKETDPEEIPRHYIDIDNYPAFLEEGRIPQAYDSVVVLYGEDFVIDQGILPWATLTTYDSLVNSFLRHDWGKAVLFASDLGHYIADASMPLHITRNYNGQYSGNYGIHGRYENEMIDFFLAEIDYGGSDISLITDVDDYIFNRIYSNYQYVDSVIAADDYARAIAGNTSSPEYLQALWEKSESFTVPLFSQASHTLAELLLTAWTEAGRPVIDGSGIVNPASHGNSRFLQIFPNPCSDFSRIRFTLSENSMVCIEILNINGTAVATPVNGYFSEGVRNFIIDFNGLLPGIYIISVKAGKFQGAGKVIKAQ